MSVYRSRCPPLEPGFLDRNGPTEHTGGMGTPPPTTVWMMNLGGPDSPEAIQPFLYNLLSDAGLIPFPAHWMRRLFASWISNRRAKVVRAEYLKLGGASPQLEIVRNQAKALEASLGEGFSCRPVFRYWGESADDAAAALKPDQPVVLLSLFPHRCGATTQTCIHDAERALADHEGSVRRIESYPSHPRYVQALAESIQEAISHAPVDVETHLVFSAHGIPVSWVENGDPYLGETQATVEALVAALGDLLPPWHLAFQSKLGRAKWLQPSTIDTLSRLGEEGVKSVIVAPISFTCDHVETLIEIDEQLRDVALEHGIEHFARARSMNTEPTWIQALAELVRAAQ